MVTPTGTRIAVAGGAAFTFGYAEHPELLTAAGADVLTFDPLRDEKLPDDVHGLVIGGGFPEEHAADLSANASLRAEVAALARAGAPVIAECAGLLYLARSLDGHPMCGVLEADAVMTGQLTLGYRDAVAATSSPLGPAGTRAHGHEFHRTAVRSADGAANAWHWTASGAGRHRGLRPRPGARVLPAHALERPARRGHPHHRRRPRVPPGRPRVDLKPDHLMSLDGVLAGGLQLRCPGFGRGVSSQRSPVRSRRCPATVVPLGGEPGRLVWASEVALGGRAGRASSMSCRRMLVRHG